MTMKLQYTEDVLSPPRAPQFEILLLMDLSQHQNIPPKKPDTNEYVLFYSIYTSSIKTEEKN